MLYSPKPCILLLLSHWMLRVSCCLRPRRHGQNSRTFTKWIRRPWSESPHKISGLTPFWHHDLNLAPDVLFDRITRSFVSSIINMPSGAGLSRPREYVVMHNLFPTFVKLIWRLCNALIPSESGKLSLWGKCATGLYTSPSNNLELEHVASLQIVGHDLATKSEWSTMHWIL